VREGFDSALEERKVAGYIDALKESMWPGGRMKTGSVERTPAMKSQSRKEAGTVLETLIPELASSVVGRGNAVIAGRKLEGMLNNGRLK
jgi:sorting nexin-25